MKDKFNRLKELAIAYQIALNFDYCPEVSEIEEILESDTIGAIDKNLLRKILGEFSGWEPSDIADLIVDIL